MQSIWKWIGASSLAFWVLVMVPTLVVAQDIHDDAQVIQADGMIMSNKGETFIMSTPETKTVVVLTSDTKVQESKGLFWEKEMSRSVLIPGLRVSVEGTTDNQNRLVAQTINFDRGDLETAQAIQAGLHPTDEQVAANQQSLSANREQTEQNEQQIEQNIKDIKENASRFSELSEYDVKGEATINFPAGSSNVSAQDKEAIAKLAHDAASLKGYIIEVKGYTDATGTAAMNQKLSEDRAKAVVAYLIQDCDVPVVHVVAPAAMGDTHAVASNEDPAGRAENRRVEVKVLVNKGIAGR